MREHFEGEVNKYPIFNLPRNRTGDDQDQFHD